MKDFAAKLTSEQRKIVLEWGKNKGQGKWSNKKIFEEYYEVSENTLHSKDVDINKLVILKLIKLGLTYDGAVKLYDDWLLMDDETPIWVKELFPEYV